MTYQKVYKIIFNMELGSDFQLDMADQIIRATAESVKRHFNHINKKNKVDYSIIVNEIQKQ